MKLKIALTGYGKMGQLIEEVALKHGHNLISKLNKSSDFSL